ncbi:hypothetical protein DHB64_09620 [Antarcticibacterium sp. W02-3]|nr:hypothetical protein [Antarcticibacterium sp. W02-3]
MHEWFFNIVAGLTTELIGVRERDTRYLISQIMADSNDPAGYKSHECTNDFIIVAVLTTELKGVRHRVLYLFNLTSS